jgi:class 3 adenylate cyclase
MDNTSPSPVEKAFDIIQQKILNDDIARSLIRFLSEMRLQDFIALIRQISANRNLCQAPICAIISDHTIKIISNFESESVPSPDFYLQILPASVPLFFYQNKMDSIDYCFTLFQSAAPAGYSREKMIMHHFQGLALNAMSNYFEAFKNYEIALENACEINDISYQGWIYDCMGSAIANKGNYNEAIEYYMQSIEIKSQSNDKEGLAITCGNLGRAYKSIGEYGKSLKYFKRDLVLSLSTNDFIGQIIMHSNIGELYWIKMRHDKSLFHYQKSLELAEKIGNLMGKLYALIGIASCHLDLKNIRSFNNCISLLQRENPKGKFYHIASLIYKLKGKVNEKNKKFTLALKEYKHSIDVLNVNSAPSLDIGLMYERIAVLLKKMNNHKGFIENIRNAIKFYKSCYAYNHIQRAQDRLHEADVEEWMTYLFGTYLGESVIDSILKLQTNPRHIASRESVAVLFSDIRDFTSLSETMHPQDLIETLNEYLGHMSEVIEKNNGEIDKFIGDAIMAVFHAAPGKNNQALKAIMSAIEMVRELDMFNALMSQRKKSQIRIGIGIHFGEVVSGTMGSTSRRNFTVIGDAVNAASRIEGLTKEYGLSILVSEDIHHQCKDIEGLHFREIDRVRVKGRSSPTVLFEPYMEGGLGSELFNIYENYNRAIGLYHNRLFDEARKIFSELSAKMPDIRSKKVYELYIARCSGYLENPPPDDWDGVTTMTHK